MTGQAVRMGTGETVTVQATPSITPGLVVHRVVLIGGEIGDGFCLTHARSGLAVAYFPPGVDPEAILACAGDLAALADWTVPARDLLRLGTEDVLAVTARWGAESMGVPAYDFDDVGAVVR